MKTAISLPDDLFSALDDCARRLHLTRSALLARAAKEFIARHVDVEDATKSWNDAIAAGGQPGDDPAAIAFQRRSKEIIRGRR